jgi:hypothetical protein
VQLWFKQTKAEANPAKGRELIAAEEVGTQTRWQISTITPRTHQAVQPALGGVAVSWMAMKARIGILQQHRNRATSLIDYIGKDRRP